MIPESVLRYLDEAEIPYIRRPHQRAVTGQELAAAVHVTGHRVAKAVLVEAGGRPWIAVVPATEVVDNHRLEAALGAPARVMAEPEFAGLFPGCELGAEPPFGALYGLPVILDASLAESGPLVFRAGSHEEAIELDYASFARLERPRVADIGTLVRPGRAAPPEARVSG